MIELLFDVIIALTIALCISVPFGTFHEYLHARKAKQLGCVVTKGKRFKNETIVDTKDPVKVKQIATAPYKVIVPLAILILLIGIILVNIEFIYRVGIIIGAVSTLLIHAISYPLEGRDE